MDVRKEVLEAFWYLFRGRTDAWGSVEGRANREQVAIAHYAEHLDGKESLGVYPLLDDGTCHFAAVDIDEKVFDKALAVRNDLIGRGITAYIAESKSKGYHVYVFAEEKFVAREIRTILHHTLVKLHIKAEVFPKQDELSENTPLGNYINLPCFGKTRPFLAGDMRAVPMDIALNKIKTVSKDTIEKAYRKIPKPEEPPPKSEKEETGSSRKGNLPCFARMMSGVPEGCRDEVAFRLAVHLYRQGMPQQLAESTLLKWDIDYNQPAIGSATIRQKIKQAYSGKYGLGCLSVLIQPFCDSSCPIYRKRHGEIDFRKGNEGKEVNIGLERVKSKPPVFSLLLDDTRLELASNELLSLRKVKTKAIEELSYVPFPGMKTEEWETLVNSLLAEITDEPAPADATRQADVVEYVYEWLLNTPSAKTPEDVEAGKPIKREDGCFFKMKDAIHYLSKNHRYNIPPNDLYHLVRNAGGGAKAIRLGKLFKLWWLPLREETEDAKEERQDEAVR